MNSTNLLRPVDDYVAQHHLINPSDTIVIGLSGGPDSVFLLHYLVARRHEWQLNLIAAHLNHGWRAEADADQQWCKSLCERLNVPFVAQHAREIILDKKPNGSKEEQGRLLRRAFFNEVAQKYNAQSIALGHHHNDSIETFFLNLIRGSTISGLQGIKPKHKNIIRPLLCVTKQEILDYLKENKIEYLEDVTNVQLDFLRNRIRHQIIPAFEATDSRYENKIVQTMEHFAEVGQFLNTTTQETLSKISNNGAVDLKAFNTLSPFLQKRVLLVWFKQHKVPIIYSSAWLDEILRFIETGKKSSHTIVENWQIQKNKNILSIKALSHA
jgi:tRNA(Ile)-lysidine synthase